MDPTGHNGRIEEALWSREVKGDLDGALAIYQRVVAELESVLAPNLDSMQDVVRVLSYGYLRMANVVRQHGDMEKAHEHGDRSVLLGRESGDRLAVAQALLNHSATLAMEGNTEFRELLTEAREIFGSDESRDYKQGLGWSWLLEADLLEAGINTGGPADIVTAAREALEPLEAIENWQGVVRALSSMQRAYKNMGDLQNADQIESSLDTAKLKAQTESH